MFYIYFFLTSLFSKYEVIQLPDEHFNKQYNIDYLKFNNDYFYYDKEINDNCMISMHNLNNSEKEYYLHMDKSLTNTNSCSKVIISNIVSVQDSIYFVLARKLLKYVYNKQSDLFLFQEFTDLDFYFQKGIQYYANKLYLQYPYLIGAKCEFNPRFPDHNYYYFKVNLSDYKDNSFKDIAYPSNFYWTLFQPKSIIDFAQDVQLRSELSNYKIDIFDFNNNLLTTLSREIVDWVGDSTDFEFDGITNFNYFISEKHRIISEISLVHKVNFINPNLIMVCYSKADSSKKSIENLNIFYDFWKQEEGSWNLVKSDIHKEDIVKNNGKFVYQQYTIITNNLFHIDIDEDDGSYKIFRFVYDN
ncbi:MAG: hypothetical protein KIT33_05415 [Candidatus Kapabacteria bacterium]|nr:hypothetical protein [Ignavibacteriota bacterium]MCW5884395.1 hypothetical protein [Candidatus Kapabacteria bacterium]